ncbi:MAG: peptide chain release factor N(5)-glutamine methyltransferase [Bacillota bacterium]
MDRDNKPQTVKDFLQWAVSFLGAEKRIEAELLLAETLGYSRAKLLAYQEELLAEEKQERFQDLINRRKSGEPLQYLLGKQNFMGLDFLVNKNVLIPRSDTEVLVEETIKLAKEIAKPLSILDLCTGSGAIAVSLAKYLPDASFCAVDISGDALEVAKINAVNAGVLEKIEFFHGDLYAPLTKQSFEIIVSNPPYISTGEMEQLPLDVKKEPALALWGGEDGLDFYRRILEEAPKYLKTNGYILLEIGWQQGETVLNLLKDNNFVNRKIIKDWAGNVRVVKGQLT